jgi:hypothetical protein
VSSVNHELIKKFSLSLGRLLLRLAEIEQLPANRVIASNQDKTINNTFHENHLQLAALGTFPISSPLNLTAGAMFLGPTSA